MSTKLEQVAEAIFDAAFDCGCEDLPYAKCEIVARAAIEAMRQPTEAMDNAGAECGPDRGHDTYWEAMIDAALK